MANLTGKGFFIFMALEQKKFFGLKTVLAPELAGWCKKQTDIVGVIGQKNGENLNWQDSVKICTASQFPDKGNAVIIGVQVWK